MADPMISWDDEDNYWRTNYATRPYAAGATDYDRFRGGYPPFATDGTA